MNGLRLMAAGVLLFGTVTGVRAEEKADNAKLIVGVWEVVKSEEGKPPNGTLIEFTNDGKMKMSSKIDGKEVTLQGTYTVEGDQLTLAHDTGSGKEKKETAKIKKLTATEFMVQAENSKVTELKRKK